VRFPARAKSVLSRNRLWDPAVFLWKAYGRQFPPRGIRWAGYKCYIVAVVRTDVSENISPPSSGFLRLVGFHSCVGTKSQKTSIIDSAVKASQKTLFFHPSSRVGIRGVSYPSQFVLKLRTYLCLFPFAHMNPSHSPDSIVVIILILTCPSYAILSTLLLLCPLSVAP
jgi:hypothetical protein